MSEHRFELRERFTCLVKLAGRDQDLNFGRERRQLILILQDRLLGRAFGKAEVAR